MNYVGIDPSLSSTGIVCIDSQHLVKFQRLISTKSVDSEEYRFFQIVEEISKLLQELQDNVKIAIEGLSFHSTGRGILELAGLHYIIRDFLYRNKFEYQVVPPTVLKKFVTGKGNSAKNVMLLMVFKKWNVEFTDDNICDAYVLARYISEGNRK